METKEMDEEELKQYKNYLVNGSKYIEAEGKHYRVPAVLQIFVDKTGQVKLLREV